VKALPHNIIKRFSERFDRRRFFTYGRESAVALQGRANWQHRAILWETFSMKLGAVDVRAIKSILVRITSVVVVMNFDD
jgi:hypothetical protein